MTSEPAYLTEMANGQLGWLESTTRNGSNCAWPRGCGRKRASGRKAGKKEGRSSRLVRRMAAAAADEEEGVTLFHSRLPF